MTNLESKNSKNNSARPRVSIIIPAFEAETTLKRALDSLRKQTLADWEAVIVDDGSSDRTLEIATNASLEDARFRVFHQKNRGASAARNHGLTQAKGEWIGFLDSDDWFDRAFLQKLLKVSVEAPNSGVVYCDFALVDGQGRILAEHRIPELHDPFLQLGLGCVLSVHCALIRKEVMDIAGNFDEGLALNEDWDLWQRIARTGTAFSGIRGIFAFYYSRPKSLSRRLEPLLMNGLEVIDRICSADPKIAVHDPRYVSGLPAEFLLPMKFHWLITCAAAAIADGQDPAGFIDRIPNVERAVFSPQSVIEALLGGLAFGLFTDKSSLAKRWLEISSHIERFLVALQHRIGQRRSIDMARFLIAKELLGGVRAVRELTLETITLSAVDIKNIPDSFESGNKDTLAFLVCRGQKELGVVFIPTVLPVTGDIVRAAIAGGVFEWPDRKTVARQIGLIWRPSFWTGFAASILRSRGWAILANIGHPSRILHPLPMRLKHLLLQALAVEASGLTNTAAMAINDNAMRAIITEYGASLNAETKTVNAQTPIAAKVNSPEYWDKVFKNENPWSYDSGYEQTKYVQTLSLLPKARPKRALELACAEGHFTVQLAPLVDELVATDISTLALTRAAERCKDQSNVEFKQLDFFNNPLSGIFDLVLCSEVLYECHSFKKLQRIARNIADHLSDGGSLIMAHVIEASEEPGRTGFDWDGVFGSKTIEDVFTSTSGLKLVERIETELYRVHRFKKNASSDTKLVTQKLQIGAPPEPQYCAYVVWGGAVMTRKEASVERAVDIPILMYHRIAEIDEGPGGLAQYRLSPKKFEQQLRWLRQNGYHSISPDELSSILRTGKPVPGRPVVLTFDDAYRDFGTAAWPLLQHYGLNATVAVVTEMVGKTAEWDRHYGQPAPLMTWDEIRTVHAEGATVASHSATHPALPTLSSRQAVLEALSSRNTLEQQLGRAPTTIIYPYGFHDPVASAAFRMSGYRVGFGTDDAVATLLSDPMNLPRIDVNGHCDLDSFVRRITAASKQAA